MFVLPYLLRMRQLFSANFQITVFHKLLLFPLYIDVSSLKFKEVKICRNAASAATVVGVDAD